jgi:hypothetical protein
LPTAQGYQCHQSTLPNHAELVLLTVVPKNVKVLLPQQDLQLLEVPMTQKAGRHGQPNSVHHLVRLV